MQSTTLLPTPFLLTDVSTSDIIFQTPIPCSQPAEMALAAVHVRVYTSPWNYCCYTQNLNTVAVHRLSGLTRSGNSTSKCFCSFISVMQQQFNHSSDLKWFSKWHSKSPFLFIIAITDHSFLLLSFWGSLKDTKNLDSIRVKVLLLCESRKKKKGKVTVNLKNLNMKVQCSFSSNACYFLPFYLRLNLFLCW